MKKAKFINSENVEIIDYEDFLKSINEDFDQIVRIKHVTDEELSFLEKKDDENIDRFKKIREEIENERNIEIEKLSDYLEFVPCKKTDLEKFSTRKLYYTKSDNKVYEHEIIINDEYLIKCEIDSLKNKLSSTDYMIIKTYEAKINNEDAPYSSDRMDKVMEQRKNYREKINELESLLDKDK
jgi:hypothetical protein